MTNQDQPHTPIKSMEYTQDAWHAKGVALFGEDYLQWRFVCPACHRITRVAEFKDVGAKPNDAYQECIGRHTGGRQGPHKCDWAAYGFFSGPHKVIGDDGRSVWVFPFAEDPA